MPPIAPQEMTPAQQAAVVELQAARGIAPRGPWIPLLRSPEVLARATAMGDYLRYNSLLPPRLSEFVILMTAREWTQHYEWHAHREIALDAGGRPIRSRRSPKAAVRRKWRKTKPCCTPL